MLRRQTEALIKLSFSSPWMRGEAETLMKQARHQRYVAGILIDRKIADTAAFLAQQAAEMALKALHVERFGKLYLHHNLNHLGRVVRAPGKVQRSANMLMPVYLTARYADARKDGVAPAEAFTEQDAKEAVNAADEVITWVESQLKN
jgi:HEPN domain-containing protein